MTVALITALLLLSSSGQRPSREVDPFQLMYRPVDWIGKRMRICGKPFRQPDGQRQVYVVRNDESEVVDVDDAIMPITDDGRECYDGYFRRRDGLTGEEAKRRGLVGRAEDEPGNPDYILSAR